MASSRLAVAVAAALLVPGWLMSQNAVNSRPGTSGPSAKTATATRTSGGSIQIDGKLDDEAWARATPITDFVQKEPNEGTAPTEGMEVRFLYDDDALYVGARMSSRNPAAIQAPLSRRDGAGDIAEQFLVSIDAFLDRRTSYTFGVTASGVRIDRYSATDAEGGDAGFDPVWEAKAHVDEAGGWTAELWIPFTQIRFNDTPVQTWGLNVRRYTPTLDEEDYWVMVPRTQTGWASRFGQLVGIEGVRPSRRVELLPFVVGSTTHNANRDLANPFDDGKNLVHRFGLDLKAGVGPNLTLDATVNPDFGQVEADPAEVNLTDFATRFPERRPFFTEGSGLLNLNHPNVFYSRRIGSPPFGRASGDYVDYPSNSRIVGAAKLTGRLPSGTSIGVLAAMTDEEFANVADYDTTQVAPVMSRVRVGPRAGYAVAKVAQDVWSPGSNIGFLVGGVLRELGHSDPLAQLSPRRALVAGTDGLLRIRGGEYQWDWAVVGSTVSGEPAAIARVQRSSSHYLQRPDRDSAYVIDPTRKSLTGWSLQTRFSRVSGRHWLFGTTWKVDHPYFETNDIAQLTGADGIQPSFNVTFRETRPGKVFRAYSLRLNQGDEWNFDWDRQMASLGLTTNVTWLNFWTSSISFTRNLRISSSSLTRGGPLMGGPGRWNSNINVGNPSSSQNRMTLGASISGDEIGAHSVSTNVSLTMHPGPQWEVSARPSFQRSRDSQQYVTTLSNGRAATYGSRYIFAYIDRTTYSMELRLSYTLKPDVTLDVYAEPFAASGKYFDFGELTAPKSRERITYGTDSGTTVALQPNGDRVVTYGASTFTLSNRDFNQTSFNSNVVLKWEWRPGSTLYLVWQQARNEREPVGTTVGPGDLFGSVSTPGSNIFLIKASWWVPVR